MDCPFKTALIHLWFIVLCWYLRISNLAPWRAYNNSWTILMLLLLRVLWKRVLARARFKVKVVIFVLFRSFISHGVEFVSLCSTKSSCAYERNVCLHVSLREMFAHFSCLFNQAIDTIRRSISQEYVSKVFVLWAEAISIAIKPSLTESGKLLVVIIQSPYCKQLLFDCSSY